MDLIKLRPYRVYITNDIYVDVHAECVDDALQFGINEIAKKYGRTKYEQAYIVWTPLSKNVDYIDLKRIQLNDN